MASRAGRTSGPAAWLLVALALGAAAFAGRLLLERARPSGTPEPVPAQAAATEHGAPGDPLAVPGVAPAEPPADNPEGRAPAEGERHRVEGAVRDAVTGLPVPLYEVYLAAGAGGDPASLPGTRAPHHVRDLEGRFELLVQGVGAHRLLIRSDTHEDLAGSVSVPLEAPLELRLHRGTWIEGVLRNALREPQPDVTVWLHSRDAGPRASVEGRTRTDAEGRFAFHKLEPGAFRLTVGPLGAPLVVRDDLVLYDRQHLRVELVVPGLTEVVLVLTSPDGAPVEGARVTLYTSAGGVVRTALSGADGEVRVPQVQEGEHLLEVRAEGFAPLSERLSIGTSGPRVDLRRVLER